MNRPLKLTLKMIRIAKLWEWAALCLTLLFCVLTLFPRFFHIPRLVAGLLMIPTVTSIAAIWFVLDLLWGRAGNDV